MMAGAILTQNTAWTNVEKAICALKRFRSLTLRAIARMPRRRLEKLIRPTGYFRQKAERLREFARTMMRDHALRMSLMPSSRRKPGSRRAVGLGPGFHRGDVDTVRNRLLSLRGIGPETADSILLYAGGYPVFVVDAYTRRIGQRMGFFKVDDYDKVQAFFQDHLPRDAALYNEFHALIVRLAKECCTKKNPKCVDCPINVICAFAFMTSSRRKPGTRT